MCLWENVKIQLGMLNLKYLRHVQNSSSGYKTPATLF